jgi:hypothetical protein
MIRLVLAVLVTTMVSSCTTERVAAPDSAARSSSSRSPVTSAETLCRDTFESSTVLGWTAADVGELRAYQYGGPAAHFPLRSAFAGIPATQKGAWCWVRQGPGSGSLWGAVPGATPQRAITVTGPGEDRFRGEMHEAPVVP